MQIQKALVLLIRNDIRRLEYDPNIQYRANFLLTWFWFLAMVALPFVPVLYGHSLPALVVQEISLYANMAAHFTGMSSALAAKEPEQMPSTELPPFDA